MRQEGAQLRGPAEGEDGVDVGLGREDAAPGRQVGGWV